jgi:hypothetical protein
VNNKEMFQQPHGALRRVREIIYIGMARSQGGLKMHLRRFYDGLNGRRGYSGARCVRLQYPSYRTLAPNLYVSICPYECDIQSNQPKDLRMMGDIARHEYESFAVFVEKNKRLPKFNDMKQASKR